MEDMNNRKYSDTICMLPLGAINIHATGKIVRCHMSEDEMGDIDSDDPIIYQWNNKKFRDLRKKQRDGEWDKGCINCQTKEKNNIKSKRLQFMDLENYNDLWNKKNLLDSDIKTDIWHLDIAFNNICNFKCRMCSSAYSNSWIHDEKKLIENNVPGGSGGAFQKKSVSYERQKNKNHSKQLEELLEYCNNLKKVEIIGGEPFLTNECFNFLDAIKSKGLHKQIDIMITTNGSVITEEKLNYLLDFKYVNINFSLDAVGPLFEYMRSAGVTSWNEIKEKIYLVKNWCDKNRTETNNYKMCINGAYQIYNCLNFKDFIEFIIDTFEWEKSLPSRKSHSRHSFEHRMCMFPKFLSVIDMDKNLVKESLKQIHYIQNKYKFLNSINERSYIFDIKNILNNVNNFDLDKVKQFKKYTKELDIIRNQSLKDYAPEVYNEYQKYEDDDEVFINIMKKPKKIISLYNDLLKVDAWKKFNIDNKLEIKEEQDYYDAVALIREKKINDRYAFRYPENIEILKVLEKHGKA